MLTAVQLAVQTQLRHAWGRVWEGAPVCLALPEVPAWDVIRAVHCPARCVYTLREAAGLPGMPRTIQPPLRQCSTRQANPPAPAGTLATHFPAYRDRPAWQPWQYPAPSKQREQPVGHCSQGKGVAMRQVAAGKRVAWEAQGGSSQVGSWCLLVKQSVNAPKACRRHVPGALAPVQGMSTSVRTF